MTPNARTPSRNKVWFITGASRGFGALIARDALERGDSVVATARNPQTIIDQLDEHLGLLALKLDVTDEVQAKEVVKTAIEKFGRIDVLVNNAGYGLIGAVEESAAEEVRALYETNVFGLLHVTRAVLPAMRAARSGHVINISSVGGFASYSAWGVYCSSKFAVEGLSEALYHELAPLGVKVTVVEPGFFRTDFLDASSLKSTAIRIDEYAETVGAMRRLMADVNHKQPGDPLKLSQAILRLSDTPTPPQRLQLGSDTVAKLHEKHRFVEAELEQWISVATSTDHEAPQAA